MLTVCSLSRVGLSPPWPGAHTDPQVSGPSPPWISVSSSEQWDASLIHRNREVRNQRPTYRVSALLERVSHVAQTCLELTYV